MRLSARDLRWSAGKVIIVDEVSVEAAEGKVLGILGPNGSGKSTLLSMLANVLEPKDGVRELDGRDYSTWQRKQMARHMAVVQQIASTDRDLSVRDVIDLGRIPHRGYWHGIGDQDKQIIREAAEKTGVDGLLKRNWHTLSGGEQQRTHIARALAQHGDIMLFDEPTNHLDIAHQLDILDTLKATGITLIVALHDLNLAASFCDRVMILSHGKAVAAGDPNDILTVDLIREVYRVNARIIDTPDGSRLFQFISAVK